MNRYVKGKPNNGLYEPRNLGSYGYSWNNVLNHVDPTGEVIILVGRADQQAASLALLGQLSGQPLTAQVWPSRDRIRPTASEPDGGNGADSKAYRESGDHNHRVIHWRWNFQSIKYNARGCQGISESLSNRCLGATRHATGREPSPSGGCKLQNGQRD